MNSSQIYILKNKSYQKNVLKIGMTKNQSDSRAKQIYAGSTGVPEPFDVIFACSVADCRAAESKVHYRLAAYRVNNSREFFRIPAKIAKKIVFDVCSEVNIERKYEQPIILVDLITIEKHEFSANDKYQEKYGEVFLISPDKIRRLPIGTSDLNSFQKERISIIRDIMSEVFPDQKENWFDSFSRDKKPETEIRIWEHIAKAFLKIDEIDYLNIAEKKEAYELLLARSLSPTKIVLQECKLRYFTKEAALKIMAAYELPPKPIVVSKINSKIGIKKNLNLKPVTSVIPEIIASCIEKKSDL